MAQTTGFFSRFYDSELSLNPAFAGNAQEGWKFNNITGITGLANGQKYYTNSASFHLNFKFSDAKDYYGLKVITERDYRLGAGILDERRWSEDFRYSYFSDYLNFAYHKISPKGMFSIGVQGGVFKVSDYLPPTDASLPDSLQAAEITGEFSPDFNMGIMYQAGDMSCWKGDQLYRFQIGLAGYHLLENFNNQEDTTIFPARQIQAHTGYLIGVNRAIGVIPRAFFLYNGESFYNAGFTVLFRRHENFLDRLRLGMHYKSTNHLIFSAGIRFFWGQTTQKAIDIALSFDDDIEGQNPYYQNNIEFSISFYPFVRCWETSKCSDAYKYEEF